LFYIDWRDIQISKVDPTLNVSFNANGGTARSRGVELSTSYSPVRNFVIGFNASYVDATLTEDVPELNGRDGDRLSYAPKWDASLTADYDVRVTPLWSAHFGGGYRYVGDRYSDVQSSPFALRAPSYTVLDLNASVSNDRWTFRLYGRNLTDERAYLSPSAVTDPLSGAPDHVETAILQPRTIGLSADVRF
jgi:outer membrane receptor protein involved in Fe transport